MTSEATREERLREIRAHGELHPVRPVRENTLWLLSEVARLEAENAAGRAYLKAHRRAGDYGDNEDEPYDPDEMLRLIKIASDAFDAWVALAQNAQSVAGKEG